MTWKTTEIAFPGITENYHPSRFWCAPDGRHVVMAEGCREPRSTRLRVYVAGEDSLLPHGTIDLGGETPSLLVTSDAVVWWKDGRMNAASLPTGEHTEVPLGCVMVGSFPAALGASAERVVAKGWRTYRPFVVSPDARWFVASNYRHEVDVIFDAETVEEAKALAKKQRVLALSNQAVAVATKTSEWALLTAGTWKKLGAGKCATGIREAHFSSEGAYLALVAGKTITLVDAQTAVMVSEQEMPNTIESLAWITGQRLVCKLHSREGLGLAHTFSVLDPALPLRAPIKAVEPKAPAKKTKAKASRSAALGLPFELAWSQPEAVLRDLIKDKPCGVFDRALVQAEAAILDPTYRGEAALFGNYTGSLAAALLLRAPACAAYFDELLARHLDHADVRAVLPLLSESGKGRLACTYVLGDRVLEPAQRRALSRFIVLDVWNSNMETKVTPPKPSPRLSNRSTYARIQAYASAYGDPVAFADAMHALWELGRAKSIEGHEVELEGDFASFTAALAKNPTQARAALAHRASSKAGAMDTPSDVAAWVAFVEHETPKADDARVPQLAYALTVLARAGQNLPEAARPWLVRSPSEIEARALAHFPDDASDSLLTKAWVAAVRWQPSLVSLLERLFKDVAMPTAAYADLSSAARIADAEQRARLRLALPLVDFIVANAPLEMAGQLAMTILGKLDGSAFSLLLRARDAGVLVEDAAWFTSTTGMGWDRTVPLLTCSDATQKAVVSHWLETGTNLPFAAKFDFTSAVREAVLRADLSAISNIFKKENMDEWMPLLRAHIRASKDPDAVLTRLKYMGPSSAALENLRKLALGEETASMRIQRLLDALAGPKKKMTFFFQPQALTLDIGEEALTTYVRIDAPKGEEAVVTVALEDVPELRAKYPAASSLTVFGRIGKNPSRVATRIALHTDTSAEHQALMAAPKHLRRITLEVPEDFLGSSSGPSAHAALREAIPSWRFIALPHYSYLTTQPLFAVSDTIVTEREGDEGELLVFGSGPSRHRYA